MDLRQLEYFVTVARIGHFTQSAERLHVGQPALSQAIRRLERELGVELLDRGTHPVGLTSAGRVLLPHAEAAIEAIAAARAEFGYVRGEPRGKVTLGVLGTLGIAEQIVADFHRSHPDVEIVLHEDLTSNLMELLQKGQVDALIATKLDPLPRNVESLVAFSEPMVVMAPVGWSGEATLTLRDLEGSSVLLPAEGSAVRAIVERALQRARINWRVGPETNDLQRQRYLASVGVGVAIVPQSAATASGPEVVFLPLDEDLEREVALMWRIDRRPGTTVHAFLERARALIDDLDRSRPRVA